MQKMMMISMTFAIAFAISIPAFPEELVTLSWDTTRPLAGQVIEDSEGKGAVLAFENDTGVPMTATFARVENPGVTASNYALHGTVRYDGVEGVGYLEMWNVFPDGSRYFSRTLADLGPLRKISGSSGWREFALSFSLMDSPLRPSVLVLNLVLPGKGAVVLGSLELVQYESAESMAKIMVDAAGTGARPGWWTPIVGEAMLVLGSFVLVLASGLTFGLARRGKARTWGLAFPWFEIALGWTALIGGVSAVMSQQPAWVRTPLIALGLLGILFGAVLVKIVANRYTALELRRMQSQNIG